MHTNPKRDVVAAADHDGNVRLCPFPCAAGVEHKVYGGHGAPATCVRFMADARHVLTSGGPDNTIFVWKHTVGQQKGARGAVKAAEPKGRRRGPGERRNILQGYADLLAKHDADGEGVIDFEELRELVREDLRLATDQLPEARLARLFHKADAADARHPGACSIGLLAEFLLATGERRAPRHRDRPRRGRAHAARRFVSRTTNHTNATDPNEQYEYR